MPNPIALTGTFLDPAKRPLKGSIVIKPLPEMVIEPDTDTVYMGQIEVPLDEAGAISTEIIPSEGWVYEVHFKLSTQEGKEVCQPKRLVPATEASSLPDLLEKALRSGSARPVFTFDRYRPGELRATGATPDPADPGAILVPGAF